MRNVDLVIGPRGPMMRTGPVIFYCEHPARYALHQGEERHHKLIHMSIPCPSCGKPVNDPEDC